MSTNLPVVNADTTEQIVFHHTDHLSGDSIDTDANGNVIEAVDYYPYGEIRVDQKTTTYENKHKFTGKELDKSDNLYYYGARYYDPSIGRFISADTVDGDLSNPQSLNKYSYAINNPFRYVDPTGNWSIEAFSQFIDQQTEVLMFTGDVLTFGQFSSSIENAKSAGTMIHNEGVNFNTISNAIKEITAGTLKTGGTALMEGLALGEIWIGISSFLGSKSTEAQTQELSMMQKSVSTKFKNGNLAGRDVKDVISDLKSGAMSSEEVPIGYVKVGNTNVVVNNRSFSAIKASGVNPTIIDYTNNPKWPGAVNFAKQLMYNSQNTVFDTIMATIKHLHK